MDLRKEAEQICKDLNLDTRTDIDYLEEALKRITRANLDYETEQGFFSTVIADAQQEAKDEEKELIENFLKGEFCSKADGSKSLMPQYWIWEAGEAIGKGKHRD